MLRTGGRLWPSVRLKRESGTASEIRGSKGGVAPLGLFYGIRPQASALRSVVLGRQRPARIGRLAAGKGLGRRNRAQSCACPGASPSRPSGGQLLSGGRALLEAPHRWKRRVHAHRPGRSGQGPRTAATWRGPARSRVEDFCFPPVLSLRHGDSRWKATAPVGACLHGPLFHCKHLLERSFRTVPPGFAPLTYG